MTLRASSAYGTAERHFIIVCGDNLALTPHLGWNSWYVWENNVTDEIMLKAAEAMVSSGLADVGYVYVNIDDCWAVTRLSRFDSPGQASRCPGQC